MYNDVSSPNVDVSIWMFPICVKSLLGTLSATPLLTLYVTVSVWLAGATPYVLEYRKFDGSKPWFKLPLALYNADPTLSGLGSSSSSAFADIPAPNWICISPSSDTLVMYLFGTLFNFSNEGVSELYAEYSNEYSSVFGVSSNTVSWPR